MIPLTALLWFISEIKAISFWLYLWQLKEYHIGRFLEHFRTHQGKRIFIRPIFLFKIALFVGILVLEFMNPEPDSKFFDILIVQEVGFLVALSVSLVVFVLYGLEAAKTALDLLRKRMREPVATKKIIFLRSVLLVITALIGYNFSFFNANPSILLPFNPLLFFLGYDILTPIVVSVMVLGFQPLVVLRRNQIIAKAREKRSDLKHLKVVGITGSYGKTSTKEILAHVLSKKFRVLKTPEHRNAEIGIAHTILRELTEEYELFVCEMGAYNKGGIKLLADMVKPTMGIVTGVNEQHLGVFGSQANLFSAEGGEELARSLPQDGVLVLNADSRQLWALEPRLHEQSPGQKQVWCSAKEQKDVFAKDVVVEKEQVRFILVAREGKAEAILPLLGGHNVENALLAAAAAKELGMSVEEIAQALKDVPIEAGAMRLRKGKEGIDVIDSSYSANPSGVLAALEHLKLWKGKKIVVMPCLIELGSASRRVHEEIGRKLGETADLAIITTPDEFAALKKGAMEKGMKEDAIILLENKEEIKKKIKSTAHKGDVVLLEGRGPIGALDL